jgi:hypothetical protein
MKNKLINLTDLVDTDLGKGKDIPVSECSTPAFPDPVFADPDCFEAMTNTLTLTFGQV